MSFKGRKNSEQIPNNNPLSSPGQQYRFKKIQFANMPSPQQQILPTNINSAPTTPQNHINPAFNARKNQVKKNSNKSFVGPQRKFNNFLINPAVVEDHFSPERTGQAVKKAKQHRQA